MKPGNFFRNKYVLLMCSVGIPAIWAGMIAYTLDFPSLSGNEIVYPLSVVTQTSTVRTFIFIVTTVGFLVLLGYSNFLGAGWILTPIAFLIGCSLLLGSLGGVLLASDVTYYGSVSLNKHQYHLTRVWGGERWGYSSPIEAYTVLECDNNRLVCGYYSTPYLKDAYQEAFDDQGSLVLESGSIYLRVDGIIVPVSHDVLRVQ